MDLILLAVPDCPNVTPLQQRLGAPREDEIRADAELMAHLRAQGMEI